jgi:hypothetical protein
MTTFRAAIAPAIAGICESVNAADTVRPQVMLVGTYRRLRRQPDVQLVDPLSYLAGS